MDIQMRNGRLTGILFLGTYLVYIAGALLVAPVVSSADPGATVSGREFSYVTGIILEVLCGTGIVGIPLLLVPLVRRRYRPLNFAYLGCRLWEGGAILIMAGLLLALIPRGVADDPAVISPVVRTLYRGITDTWIPLTLGLGGLFYNLILIKERFVPSFYAFWGAVGYPLVAAGGVFEMYGIRLGTYLALPIAVYEIVFGIYLMVRGYAPGTSGSEPDSLEAKKGAKND